MENKLKRFIDAILETRKVWLLEAKEGFFAMLEDNDGEPYMPLWESEELAAKAAQGDWEGYTVTDMGFSERNMWYMKRFYLRYAGEEAKLQQAVAVLPWGHNIVMLEKGLDSEKVCFL